jgi:TetR/AcrR family transcriptional regulator
MDNQVVDLHARVGPSKTARRTKSERTKESVLVAAEALFSERGFDATTLDAIGERAGMQGTAILYHYSSKRALYEAVLDRMFTPMLDDVHRLLKDDNPLSQRFAAVTSTMVRFAAARPAAARLILREASAGSVEAGDIVGSASQHQWAKFIDALGSDVDDPATADFDPRLVWNIVIGAICFNFGTGAIAGNQSHSASDPDQVAQFEAVMIDLTHSLCQLRSDPNNA